jgi:hypothetical protein
MKHLIAAIILVLRLISVTVNALQQSSFGITGENNKYLHFTSLQFNAYFFTSEKQPYLNFGGTMASSVEFSPQFLCQKDLGTDIRFIK